MDTSIQLVVFDMAGTTIVHHGEVHHALRQALSAAGIAISYEEANAVMGQPKPTAIRRLLAKQGANAAMITEAAVTRIHQDFVQRMVDYYRTNREVQEKPEVSLTWRTLRRQGVRIALDTGFSRPIADAVIARLGWNEMLDASVTSDEVARGRPHPDMIFRAMERTGVTDVKTVAKVGDTPSDMQQGTTAGCPWVVGVTSGAYEAKVLAREPHTHLIAQLPELLPILDTAVPAS